MSKKRNQHTPLSPEEVAARYSQHMRRTGQKVVRVYRYRPPYNRRACATTLALLRALTGLGKSRSYGLLKDTATVMGYTIIEVD